MILAAGLTPAWQQILVFDDFTPGRVNRARQAVWCASGKVTNVALALHHLDAPSRTVSLVGGDSGRAIQREFRGLAVGARWVESDASTRICTTILDSNQQSTTELVENSAPASPQERDEFVRVFAEEAAAADIVVLSGSLPAETPASFYRTLLETTTARAILDIRGPELLKALDCRPWLIKPNRDELSRTLGRKLNGNAQLVAAMRECNQQGAEWVVVTHGADAVWVTSADAAFRLQPPRVPVVNPIGCGDALAAGIAAAIDSGREMLDAVKFGMAAAAENLGQLLPCRLDREHVETLAKTMIVEEMIAEEL